MENNIVSPKDKLISFVSLLEYNGTIAMEIGQDIRGTISELASESDALREQIDLMKKHHQDQLESDSIMASCGCLTKTNDFKYHKPGCKYRLICERNEARQNADRNQSP